MNWTNQKRVHLVVTLTLTSSTLKFCPSCPWSLDLRLKLQRECWKCVVLLARRLDQPL